MRHFKTSSSSLLLIQFLLTFILVSPLSLAIAETQVINNTELSLKQKFQEELDTWVLRAYEGDRDAQFKVGVLFTNDQFSQPDYEQAVYWYKQAARQDHILAQYNLGHQYLNGVGVKKSIETAMQWWLKAAKLGHALAQFNIGRAYYLGIGLPENQQEAKYWFQQAANNQEPKSLEILKELGWDNDTQVESVITAVEPTATVEPVAIDESKASSDEKTEELSQEITIPAEPQENSTETTRSTPDTQIASAEDNPITNSNYPIALYTNPNTRSILVSTVGSIIGKLNKGEEVEILNHVGEWYRIISPARFQAWVRTADLKDLSQNNIALPELATANNDVSPDKSTSNKWSLSQKTAAPEAPVATNKETTQITVNSNEWLFSQEASGYTIQLASFDTQEKVKNFLKNTNLKGDINLHRFTSKSKKISWTYFLYGAYPDKTTATSAKNELDNKQSWVRNIGKLQQNRCISWKKQIPSPKELNIYCIPQQ